MTAADHPRVVHSGAPAWRLARQISLQRIRSAAAAQRTGIDSGSGAITDAIADHVNDVEIRALAVAK